MKWFLIQSILLALGSFILGYIVHRLTWRKTSGVSSLASTDVNRFGGSAGGVTANTSGDLAARTSELTALRAEHARALSERDAKVKELSALSFEHNACKTAIAERDASLAKLTEGLNAAKSGVAGAADTEIRGLTGQIDTQSGRIAELEASLAAATTENDAALADVRSDYEGRLATMRSEHDGVRSDYEGRLATMRSEHDGVRSDYEGRLTTLRSENDGMLEKLRASHDASVAQVRLDHEGAIAKVSAEHETRLQGFVGNQDKAAADVSAAAAAAAALKSDHEREIVQLRAEHDRLTQEVHGDRDRALSGLRGDHEKALGELRRRSETAEAELAKARSEVEGHQGELEKVRGELEGTHVEIQSLTASLSSANARAVDDLEVIEGVGPAMARALNADGIRTFADVHDATETRLRSAVQKAGLKFAPSIPTWSKQAGYLVANDQEGFKAYYDYLIAGVDPAGLTTDAGNDGHYGSGEVQAFAAGSAPDYGSDDAFEGADVNPDDLLRVEGIGPKINEILLSGGVRTFRRLAAMSEDNVRAIVNAGGVSFIPSLNSWAAQAALLRDGDEAGFQALVDKLVAGRDESR